jgi:hypothetical protein
MQYFDKLTTTDSERDVKAMPVPARSGPLTWAHEEWFADIGADADQPWSFEANFAALLPGHRLPAGDAVAALNDLIERHEGLRTLIHREADGRRWQEVCQAGDRLTEIVQIVPDGPEAESVLDKAARVPFRLSEQWPIMLILFTDGPVVSRIGVILDHCAIDGWGMKILYTDLGKALRARARGQRAFTGDGAVEQPLDAALWEQSPDGRRHHDRAGAYWRQQLLTLREQLGGYRPAATQPSSPPVLHSCWLASRRAAEAAAVVAGRAGVTPSTVYLLAFGDAICSVMGTDAAGLRALAVNRLTPAAQASVRKAVMPAPVNVAGPRTPFAARLASCAAQQLHGHRFANFHPTAASELSAETLGDLDGASVTSARFNYIDSSLVGSAANSRSWGRDSITFTDPAHQGQVTFSPPRLGGSRHILSVQHRATGALLTLAWHAGTGWDETGAELLWHIEERMLRAAKEA